MASGSFVVHCPGLSTIVLSTRGEVLRRPAAEPVALTTDTREASPGCAFVALRGESFDGHRFVEAAARAGAALAIVEEAPPAEVLARLPDGFGLVRVDSTRRALGAIAHAWRTSLRGLRVAAVTGSAGKTTTRRLLEGILAEVGPTHASAKSFNNDVGVPLTLLATPDSARFLVAEIGMNHPGEILPLAELVEPEVGVITLAGRAHLEGLGSVAAVAAEKASILAAVPTRGAAVVNGENPPLLEAVEALSASGRAPDRIVRFGAGTDCHYRLAARAPTGPGQAIEVVAPSVAPGVIRLELRMAGEHNARNALAALAAAAEMGVGLDAIRAGLARVEAADMRLERAEIGARTVFNDAYNANPDAMIASLGAFAELAGPARQRVAILGEMRELGADAALLHAEVGRAAARVLREGDVLVVVGPHAHALAAAAKSAGFRGASLVAAEFSEALALDAAGRADARAAILLKGSRGARMERFLEPLRRAFVGV